MIDPTDTQQWKELAEHSSELQVNSLKELLLGDPSRLEDLSFRFNDRYPWGDFYIDFSKQKITKETLNRLVALAYELELPKKINDLFNGETVNISENRPALHTALRGSKSSLDVERMIDAEFNRAYSFADAVRLGTWRGATGKEISTVVNIGIGGSHLGPLMTTTALKGYSGWKGDFCFVSNIDPSDIVSKLVDLDPESTLFIINSKSFTTKETIKNAEIAIKWLQEHLGSEEEVLNKHLFAVTADAEKAARLGIHEKNIFTIWDWVGGRFSIFSSVSLVLMIALPKLQFRMLADGARSIDNHFRSVDLSENIPVLMGLIGIWNRNFLGYENHAVLPYSEDLKYFPSYLEQLEMESNGKNTLQNGEKVTAHTSPIILGGIGTNAQHSFFQLLHQGTTIIPSDFIVFSVPPENTRYRAPKIFDQHEILVANCFAQSKALALGSSHNSNHHDADGNRPSTTILGKRLEPYTLGQLIAVYEHKVFTMGAIWNINSFDQEGVQLGKSIAEDIENAISTTKDYSSYDPSTRSLLSIYDEWKIPPDNLDQVKKIPRRRDISK